MKLSAPSLLVGAAVVALPAYVFRVAVVHPVEVLGVPTAADMTRGEWYGSLDQQQRQTLATVPSDAWLVIESIGGNGSSNLVFLEVDASGNDSVIPFNLTAGEWVTPSALRPGSQLVVQSNWPSSNPFTVAWSGYFER